MSGRRFVVAGAALASSILLLAKSLDAQEGQFLYVANQAPAAVTIVDLATNEIAETVDLVALGFSPDAKPHHTAVEPDGSFWYVSLIGDGWVLKFDRENRLVGRSPFEAPGLLALHPTEDLLLVGRSMAAVNPPSRIGAIRRSDMRIDELDVFFPRPHAIAVDPRGGYVYTASLAVNQLATLDLAEERIELTDVEGPPHTFVQFAVSPDGHDLVVTGQMTGSLFVYDATDPAHLRPAARVTVGAWPWHPVFSPDGRFVYLGNQEDNSVTVVDASDWTVSATIEGEGLAEPHGIAVSPDGRYVYVSNRNLKQTYIGTDEEEPVGTIVVIDAASHAIVRVLEVEPYPAGMSAPTP